jgi:cobalt/nickel transport system permease protein
VAGWAAERDAVKLYDLESWSRGESWLHHRHGKAKVIVTLGFLIAVATERSLRTEAMLAHASLLGLAIVGARLPLKRMLWRAMVVLPFAATFAAISWLAGEPERATILLVKSILSVIAALLLAGTTPLPRLLRALEGLGVPPFLIEVIQMLIRYLMETGAQAGRMMQAAASRGGEARALWRSPRLAGSAWQNAAGGVGVLFATSYARAENIHQAMLARGHGGRFPVLQPERWAGADTAFCVMSIAAVLAVRLA